MHGDHDVRQTTDNGTESMRCDAMTRTNEDKEMQTPLVYRHTGIQEHNTLQRKQKEKKKDTGREQ